jgi:hypothetical protein
MAERALQTFSVRELISRVRITLRAGGGTTPLPDLPPGVSGEVAVRGRRKTHFLDSRNARDTRIAYGVDRDGTEALVTGRYTAGSQSEVGESNILIVDHAGRTVTGTNILTLNKPSWTEPLVLATSDPDVVIASLSRLVNTLAGEARQMQERELVVYDQSEFARD